MSPKRRLRGARPPPGGPGEEAGRPARPGSFEDHLALLPQHVMRPGHERIAAACAALGDPQGRYPAVLVAGTNGKGSTCAFLESALARRHGKVGLYTSPHLVRFEERIRIGGQPASRAELELAFADLARAFPEGVDPGSELALTYFEAATALAFVCFARAGIDVAVLEVGLGGRLDATSLPGTRLVSTAVTRIGLDHTEWLGPTLAHIAGEKAAIARAGVPLVSAPQEPAAAEVIARVARERLAPLVLAPSLERGVFRGERWELHGVAPGLLGAHQLQNAAVALAVLESAEEQLGISPDAAREGIAAARWPGRLEVVEREPLVVLDGAHNADGAAALARAIAELWPGLRPQVVLGVLGDKDRAAIGAALLPLAASFHTCAPASPRAVSGEVLAAELRAAGALAQAHGSVAEALVAARASGGAVLVCGSLYLVGEARQLILGRAAYGSLSG